ncbi:MAG: hypothetical protein HQK52_06865 [Oligoflexia bacterium]|nr:hypothetical protein [Oligoflexia bacterium]
MKARLISFFILILIIFSHSSLNAQTLRTQLSEAEKNLASLINQYRQQNGLSPVPLSASLSRVAQIHAWDTITHRPDSGTNGSGVSCNLHSWSNKGNWTPVCFTGSEGSFMWDKPRELSFYPGNGFEISAGGSPDFNITPEMALQGWKNSAPHNEVILNRGPWVTSWGAMGIGIYKGHAHVWFGVERDPVEAPDTATAQADPILAKDKYYRLINFTMEKEDKCLEGNQLVPGAYLYGASFMERCQIVSGQAWYFLPMGNGLYKITNSFLGPQNKCLEGNANNPLSSAQGAAFMAQCQNVTGQLWKIRPQGGHGYFQLTTEFAESSQLCLEVAFLDSPPLAGGPARMTPCQNLAKHLWRLKEI